MIKSIKELEVNSIYKVDGFTKDKPRLFQYAGDENGVLLFVPCIGGHALPLEAQGLEDGLSEGEVTIEFVEGV